MLKGIVQPQVFCYSITPQAIGVGATVNPQINLSNDSDFELIEIRATIFKAAAFTGTTLLNLSVSSGELFSNVALEITSFASTMQNNYSGYPIRMPVGTRIPANTTVNVQITNNNGETITTQVQLWGYKVEKKEN